MATVRQEVGHAVKHFLLSYCLIRLAIGYWWSKDVARGIWWRLWGYNPNASPEFHLGQVSFAPVTVDLIKLNSLVYRFLVALHGSENSIMMYEFSMYTSKRYQRYVVYAELDDAFGKNRPGSELVEFILAKEGINQVRLNYLLATRPGLQEVYEEFKAWVPKAQA